MIQIKEISKQAIETKDGLYIVVESQLLMTREDYKTFLEHLNENNETEIDLTYKDGK